MLSGAMLFVKDLPRMEAFYRDVLGLTPIEETRHPDWIEFRQAGARFSLHAIPDEIARDMAARPASPRAADPAKLSFHVSDLPAATARIEAAGAQILLRPWGAIDAVDPEGNVIGLSTG